ncbi:hypothetical protein MRX96_029862 [Rhipicephalus microplus]
MPSDHTCLFEDQARLLRSLFRDPPSDESLAQCEEAWTRAVAFAVEAVRLPPVRPGRQRHQLDPSNAVDIQRLYRRNRRRAPKVETVPPGDLAALEGHPSPSARVITVPGSTWILGPAEPPKESPAFYRRSGPTSGSRRPPGVVRVYKPFLACHSRPGRQCLLATSTGPGPRDHLAAVVVRAYRPGHQATGTWPSTDEAFQSSQWEKTPSGSGDRLQAFACLPLPVRSPMPAADTNGPWSS